MSWRRVLGGVLRLGTGALPLAWWTSALGAQEISRDGTGVGFSARLSADTVYVGQQVNYELRVSIPAEVRQRLRRNPQFVPPETRAMLAYDLPVPKRDPTGEGPEEHVFRRALFPVTAGRHSIPPSRLSYALPQSPSFFSREEERTLRSESLVLIALDPPTAGRPAAWGGAVGRWRARARVDAPAARVGDPFVLTLRIEGMGNATLLPRPRVAIAWANVVTQDERVVLDSTPTTLGGAKEFTWLVTPREAGVRQIPPLDYVYFDPTLRRYEESRTAAIVVRVGAGDLVTIPPRETSAQAVPLALRSRPAGAAAVTLPGGALWMWLALLAPVPWVVLRARARRPAIPRTRSPLERLDEPTVPSSDVRALFEAGLRGRTGIALEAVTDPGALAAALRCEGVTDETAREAERLRDALDTSAYAQDARAARRPEPGGLRTRARDVLRRVGEEARRHSALAIVAAYALSTSACVRVDAASDLQVLQAFTEGQTAYAGQDYTRARDAFLRAANAAPRDPAAWANLGTAAWQAGDTAAAVLGWQRALRLSPLDDDLRRRLARVRAPQTRGVARVWPLPPLPLALAGALLWTAGWGWAAWRTRRRRSAWRAAALVGPGLVLALLAVLAEWQARARDLVVLAHATPLRVLPALGAEPRSVPLVGEVVRVRERRGVWLRVELDARRDGWYPAERAYPLARD